MKALFYKELRLCASPLSYFFILAAFLAFVPGYPILLSAFFTTLGIFYSYQQMRENNDMQYSLLLPVAKSDIVKGKFIFTVFIEMLSFVIISAITLIRMLFLKDAAVYTSNALMCANLTFLGFALLIFGLFNFLFVSGFFKTAYYFGKPFITYCVFSLLTVTAAETLHHLPGLETFNSFGFDRPALQSAAFAVGAASFIALTVSALKRSERSFEMTDL